MKTLTAAELKEMIDNGDPLQLVDAREYEDFEIYHIKTAFCIPRSELLEKSDLLSNDIPVVIYCKYGMKSAPSIKNLENEKGFTNLYSLAEGLYDWMKLYDRNALDLL